VSNLTIEEVKKLPILKIKEGDKAANFKMIGFWGENWVWIGGECWFTVQHQGQVKRVRHKSTPFYNEEG